MKLTSSGSPQGGEQTFILMLHPIHATIITANPITGMTGRSKAISESRRSLPTAGEACERGDPSDTQRVCLFRGRGPRQRKQPRPRV